MAVLALLKEIYMKAIQAKRLLIGLGLSLAVGLPTVACMGDSSETPNEAPAGGDDDAGEDDAASKIVGKWQMQPDKSELRNLMIIDAALSGKPKKKDKLGKLSGTEQALFNEWKGKKGAEADFMKAQIKLLKGYQLTFTSSQVTVKFGPDSFGPVSYTVKSASDSGLTVTFDPGLGNGVETHKITWSGDGRGTDNISTASGQTFIPLNLKRMK
jgi:hypothetical protein